MKDYIHFVDHDGNSWYRDIEEFRINLRGNIPLLKGISINDNLLQCIDFYKIEVHVHSHDVSIAIGRSINATNIHFFGNVKKYIAIGGPNKINLTIDECVVLEIGNCADLENIEIKNKCGELACLNCPNLKKLPNLPYCRKIVCHKKHFNFHKHLNIPVIMLNY